MRGCLRPLLAALSLLVWTAASASAATLEPVGTFASPVFVTSEPDPDRLLVVEQGGRIVLSEDGAKSTYLDISSRVTPGGEQGLLSVALAPDYATSKRLYVFYVNTTGDLQVDEYTANSIPVDPTTRRPVLTVPHPGHSNHNGGQLQFGPDGYLYISTGDGGGGGDPDLNAQDLESLLGKILRIDPDGGGDYSVPADNPFVGSAGADEIWSYGLRNPFRFSFDRGTGDLLIGDVGQGSREEVDFEPYPNGGRADNFGWSCREGLSAYSDATPDPACAGASGFTDPILDYDITGSNCAITGGYVVRDPALGDLVGRYVYADFCVGQVRSLVPALPRASADRSENLTVANPSSFGEDSCGRLYVASLGGSVFRFAGDVPSQCPPAGGSPPPGPRPGEPAPPAGPADDPPFDGGGIGAGPDTDPPRLRIRVSEHRDLGEGLVAKLTSDEDGPATARAAIKEGDRRLLRLGEEKRTLVAGEPKRFRWQLEKGEERRVRKALRDGKLSAHVRGRARDAAGNASDLAETAVAIG